MVLKLNFKKIQRFKYLYKMFTYINLLKFILIHFRVKMYFVFIKKTVLNKVIILIPIIKKIIISQLIYLKNELKKLIYKW